MSEVILTSVQEWRARARENTLDQDQMKAAIAAIREERMGKGAVSAASKVKKAAVAKKKEPVNSDALLSELGL